MSRGCGAADRPVIPHKVHRWVWGHSKYFLFSDSYLSAGSESALVARQWDTALEIIMITTYVDTVSLLQRQKVAPIVRWEAAINMLVQWDVFLVVILVPGSSYPVVYNMTMLIDASEEVNTHLWVQSMYQPAILAALV